MVKRIRILGVALLAAAAVSGCYKASYRARSLEQAASLTADPGRLHTMVGRFERRAVSVWLLYGNIPIHGAAGGGSDWAAGAIREEVAKRGGDAAVNVRFDSHKSLLDFLTGFIPFGLLSTHTERVGGEAVRFRAEGVAQDNRA